MATSLIVPLAYITVLVTSLAIFSRVYRKRKLAAVKSWEPWFPKHPSRDIYISLVTASSSIESSNEKEQSKIPLSILKSALLVRATADVKRIWRIRDDKMALASLHNRGLVGDDTMARFAAAEKELEAEIVDVVSEANTFRQGWGQMIFQTATEMAQAERTREVVLNIPRVKVLEDRKMARRRKYIPGPAPMHAATPANTPAKALAGNASASAQASSSGPAEASSSTSQAGTPAKPTVLDSLSPPSGSPATGTKSGQSSGASTPAKNTPSKKKKGKK